MIRAICVGIAAVTLLTGMRAATIMEDHPVTIAAGTVPFGEDGPGRGGVPTAVAAFRIDPHEVTNRQFSAFVAATGWKTQAEREGAAPVFVMPAAPVALDNPASWWKMVRDADWRHPRGPGSTIAGHAEEPVVQVSYEDAVAYAHWAGGRLPTGAEWERAARSDQRGTRAPESWIQDASGSPVANIWQGIFPIRNTGDDGHVGIAPVESYRPNGFGLYDMVGNVWEWTSQPASDGRRVVKGGSFLCASNYCANYRPAAWQAQEQDLGASHIGFRVAWPI